MTENHILDVMNKKLQSLMADYNETLESCFDMKNTIGEVPNSVESKFIAIDHTVDVLKDFAETVGWAFIMNVDTDGFITRLEAI